MFRTVSEYFMKRRDFNSASNAIFCLCRGFAVFLSWVKDDDLLKRIYPGMVSMNPMTANGFILSGTCLWLIKKDQSAFFHPTAMWALGRLDEGATFLFGLPNKSKTEVPTPE